MTTFRPWLANKRAVALEYQQNSDAAPIITASGENELAELIVEEARRQGVLIARDEALAMALSRLPLEEQVPPELYRAVAIVLAWSYWLRGLSPGEGGAEV